MSLVESDVKQMVLGGGPFGPQEIKQIVSAIAEDFSQYRTLRDSVAELEAREERSPAAGVRLGVCQYLLGRYGLAVDALKTGDGGALAHFYLAKCYFAQQHYDEAIASYEAAHGAGYNADDCILGKAEAQRMAGNADAALATLDQPVGAVEQTAEYLYQRGATVAALGGNPPRSRGPVRAGRRGRSESRRRPVRPGHAKTIAAATTRWPSISTSARPQQFPTYVGTLLNLGVLYEDRQQYDRAQQCYQRILESVSQPCPGPAVSEGRAGLGRHVLRRRRAAQARPCQPGAERAGHRLRAVGPQPQLPAKDGHPHAGRPGPLHRAGAAGQQEFGETSLVEIREMLASKGLSLGQFATTKPEPEPAFEPEFMSPDEQAMLDRPIADLNLSVRARKCMIRLGLNTIGELRAAHRRRTAGVQELRRDQPERSPREADAPRPEAARRLSLAAAIDVRTYATGRSCTGPFALRSPGSA